MSSHPCTSKNISDLPAEVLLKVFKYLSASERKAVKLTCKSWSGICKLPALSNDEVLNCLGIYQLSDIYRELLNRSECRWLNLRFDSFKFDAESSFWKNNGSRIRSLTFKNCQFYDGFLAELITCCENLVNLSFISSPLDELVKVSGNGIIRENLISLKIHHCESFTENNMIQLLSIFPKLRILKITSNSTSQSTFTAVLKYLRASRDRIEILKLHFPCLELTSYEFHCFQELLTAMQRLTILSINFSCRSVLPEEELENYFYSKPLKSLVYDRRRWSSVFDQFSFQFLLSNSSLKHLKIKIRDGLEVSQPLYENLMSSSLNSCHLDIGGGIWVEDDSLDSVEPAPTASPSLSVSIYGGTPEDSIISFFRNFKNLRHLRIFNISYITLLALIRFQTELKSLIIKNEHTCTILKNDLTLFDYGFIEFTNMEHLELESASAYIFLKSLSPDLILPNLKYLKINLNGHACGLITTEYVKKLTDSTPFLEGLYIHDCGILHFVNLYMNLCKDLSRLRFLRWSGHKDWPRNAIYYDKIEYYHDLFTSCPSLRVLRHDQDHLSLPSNTFFFDVINKKVTQVENPGTLFYTFAKPKIGGFAVDWFVF